MEKINKKNKWFAPISICLSIILCFVLSCSSNTDSLLTLMSASTDIVVSFELNEGTTTTELRAGNVLVGKAGTALTIEDPTKKGYTFTAWNPELPSTFPTKDSTYEAKYSIVTYQISYELKNSNALNANPGTYKVTDSTITLVDATSSVSSDEFVGWYTTSTYETAVTTIPSGSTGNLILYAKWS
ncbi:MAG: hypothetical protein GX677_10540 [Treponema sp.]|nr:hypothetical protein [Treponema sp.]